MADAASRTGGTRRWAPRMWLGCTAGAWRRILFRHRFAVEWPYWHIAAVDSVAGLVNSTLAGIQNLAFGRSVARIDIAPPVIILGHWRSGTTLLHELMALDPRLTYPTNYECFCPSHFLLTESLFPRLLGILLPARRPMDNMHLTWQSPQEDEFALCNLGVPSPYLKVAFPNLPVAYPEYGDLGSLAPEAFAAWQAAWTGFLRRITYRRARPLVLKSPQHSFRIAAIERIFPKARFIYMVRNPIEVFVSTLHLWKCLYAAQGLQRPRCEGLEREVLETGRRLFEAIERSRPHLPADRFCEVRFEDLKAEPIASVRRIYDQLGLGDVDTFRDQIEQYLASKDGYAQNRYEVNDRARRRVTDLWYPYFARYGYASPAAIGHASSSIPRASASDRA